MTNFMDGWGARVVSSGLGRRCRTLLPGLAGLLWLASAAGHAAPLAYLADRLQNDVSVVDLANYATLATISLGPAQALPVDVVASEASGKVFVAQASGLAIIDAATNAITGHVALAGIKAMAASPDGKKVYALTPGAVAVIDAEAKSVLTTLAVDPSAVSLAASADGDSVYVAHTGFAPASGALGAAGITVIDGVTHEIDNVVSTGDFQPEQLAVHPGDERLYMIGKVGLAADNLAYRTLDPVTLAITRTAFALPPETPVVLGLSSLAFNPDGSRLYLGANTLGVTTLPVLEINTATGTVARVLSLPAGFADEHTVLKLATGLANGQFTLAAFVRQRLRSSAVEPGRRAVFMDAVNGTVLGDLNFPSPGDRDVLSGDILDAAPAPTQGKAATRTGLQANANPPLRPEIPVTFVATVQGNNPGGRVVFKFATQQDGVRLSQKVPVELQGGTATLALAACSAAWDNLALQKIACSPEFRVVARFKGDAGNAKSRSETLYERY